MKFSSGYKVPLILVCVVVWFGLGILISPAAAQDFSGANIDNYDCPDRYITGQDEAIPGLGPLSVNGDYVCYYNVPTAEGGTKLVITKALPEPPTLRQLEFWFVRILYASWALAGIFFTLVLMYIGFEYITSFGNEIALGNVVKRFRNWMIGLALVFLSYPVLNTFFNVLGIDQTNSCYADLNLPGFRFFFPTACGDIQTLDDLDIPNTPGQ